MGETITLQIDAEVLTKAIAVALVERSSGKERLQVIESKQVARHVKNLLTDGKIEADVAGSVRSVMRDMIRERLGSYHQAFDEVIRDFFVKHKGMYSRAEESVHEIMREHVCKIVYDKRGDIAHKIAQLTMDMIAKLKV